MSTEQEDKLPGVTLYWAGGGRYNSPTGEKLVKFTVQGRINDEETWKAVEASFLEGFRVYTALDFKGELLEALRAENRGLVEKMQALEQMNADLRTRCQSAEYELSRHNEQLVALGRSIRGK